MTNEEQKLREFAGKIVPVILNAGLLCNTEEIVEAFTGDLTALISEGYVSKEEHSKVLQQRDELREALEEQKRLYFNLFDEDVSCMYCEAKLKRGSAIVLCKECAENTEG